MTAVTEARERVVSVSARRRIANGLTLLLLTVSSIFVLVPLGFMLSTALKTEEQLFVWPIRWIPNPVAWENFSQAFFQLSRIAPGLTFWRILSNTLFITLFAMTAELITVTLVAYGFARFRFPGRDILFVLMLSTMMLPDSVTLIPSFMIWRNLKLIDTYDPLVNRIWFGGGAWAVFMLRQFFLTIQREIEDAAIIDGANTFQIYYRIMLPLVKPALLALGVLIFRGNWNNFRGPLIYLNTTLKLPLTVALKFFQESISKEAPKWHYMMAMSTVMAAPILTLYFAAQNYFIEGLTVGAVKG